MRIALFLFAVFQCSHSQSFLRVEGLHADQRLDVCNRLESDPLFKNALKGKKNYTFFLPTKQAMKSFARYVSWKGYKMSKEFLEATIRYHLVNKTVTSSDLELGHNVLVTAMIDPNYVNNNGTAQVLNVVKLLHKHLHVSFGVPGDSRTQSNVVMQDIKCHGGVIHIVDKVFRFPRYTSQTLSDLEAVSMLSSITSSGLNSVVDSASNITIFVPLNRAIDAILGSGDVDQKTLKDVLEGHLVKGALFYQNLGGLEHVTTWNGKSLSIELEDHTFKVGGSKVLVKDILLRNGVMHITEKVLV